MYMPNQKLASFLLRIGLAIVFLYAATASFLDPQSWVGFLPAWMRLIVPGTILLPIFSIYEIALSLWLLSGWRGFESGLLAAATLLAITVANIGAFDIVFRDVAVFFAAIALAVIEKRN